ncbi:MAG: hypothetical protein OEM59_02845 [Rhodospirillales bacterium]|nr:hypothetical protein [Rhodospirillales bacterium]
MRIKRAEARPRGEVNRSGQALRRNSGTFLTLAAAALLSACATADRGEAIYYQQNMATVALAQAIMAAEFENPEAAEQLYDGEMALNRACGDLQEVGYRKLNGETVDTMLKVAAMDSLDDCAAQVSEVEELIWRLDPETAAYYLEQPVVSAMAAE